MRHNALEGYVASVEWRRGEGGGRQEGGFGDLIEVRSTAPSTQPASFRYVCTDVATPRPRGGIDRTVEWVPGSNLISA